MITMQTFKKPTHKPIAYIAPPGSPMKFIKRDEYELTQVLISYGGGMGGSKRNYTGNVVSEDKDVIVFEDILHGRVTIFKNFIVTITSVQIVHEWYDVSGHSYFGIKGQGKTTLERIIAVPLKYQILYPHNQNYQGTSEDICEILFQNKY